MTCLLPGSSDKRVRAAETWRQAVFWMETVFLYQVEFFEEMGGPESHSTDLNSGFNEFLQL